MTMPQSAIERPEIDMHPLTLAQLRTDLEKALRFHEELLNTPGPDDISIAVHRRSQTARDEVLAAMSRMIANSYGICEACEQPISEERLKAMPHTRHCVTCAQRAERVS